MICKKIDIFGIKLDNISINDLKENIINFSASEIPRSIMYANTHSVNLAQKDIRFADILNSADILHPDGWGVVWASKALGNPLKEKIVTTDFFVDFCSRLAKRKASIYILGGKSEITGKIKKNYNRKPHL